MALNSLGLGFVFTARDLASNTMRKLGANFSSFSGKAEKGATRMKAAAALGGASIGLLATGMVALAGSFKLAKIAGDFEQEMARVGAIMRATEEDMSVLNAAAKEAGILTQFSPKEAATGLANFAAQGFNAKMAVEALKPALDLAAGGMISVDQATASVAAAMKVFGKEGGSAVEITDKLLRISNLTALSAGDLQIALGNVSRGAISARQSINEMLPAIGLIRNSGVDASVASTAVSSALDFMAKNAKKFKKEFGVSVADANGDMRNFLDIVLEVNKAGKGLGSAVFLDKLIKTAGKFGKTAFTSIGRQLEEGIPDATGKILKGADAIAFLRKQMVEADGAAKEFRERMLNTFPGQLTLLQGSLQTLAISLGEPLAKILKPFVAGFIEATNVVIKFVEGLPSGLKDVIGKVILLFGVLATSGGIGLAIAAIGVLLAGAAKAIAIGLGIAVVVLGAMAGAIAVVKLAIVGFDTAMGGSNKRISMMAQGIAKVKLLFGALFALITGRPISKEMRDDLFDAKNKGIFEFVQSVGRLINRVKFFWGGLTVGFKSVFKTAKPVFDALFRAFGDLASALGFAGDGFNDFAGKPIENFINVGFKVGRVVAHVIKFMVRAVTFGINLIAGVIEGVKSAFSLFSPIIDLLVLSFAQVAEAFREFFEELGIATGGMDEGISAGQIYGKVIGFMAAAIRLVLVPVIITMLQMFRFTLKVWTLVVKGLRWGANLIVKAFNAIKKFILEDLGPPFLKFKDMALSAIEPVVKIFKQLVELITDAIKGIDKFFGITEKVSGAAEGVVNFFGGSFEDPDALSLDNSGDIEAMDRSNRSRSFTAIPTAVATAPGTMVRPGAGAAKSGAIVAERLRKMQIESAKSAKALEGVLKKGLSLNVDGQLIGKAASTGSDESDAREFRPTAVEG